VGMQPVRVAGMGLAEITRDRIGEGTGEGRGFSERRCQSSVLKR
jgi:hypothetical protein